MAARGRPPIPNEVKRKRGTARADRMPSNANLAIVPAVEPEPIDLDAADTIGAVLKAGRSWLAASDTLALVMLRESIEERAVRRESVMQMHRTEDRKALRDLDKQIISQLSQLGFDPAARSRLGLAEVKAATKLEQLRKARG
mgnify:CR=1 FL=1